MALPFHWLFHRETWVRFFDACFPERKIRRERLTVVIAGLRKRKKMSDGDIVALFKSQFGASLKLTADGPVCDKPEIYPFEHVVSHFEEFVRSRFRDHDSFRHQKLETIMQERKAAKDLEKMFPSQSASAPKPIISEGAVRGVYMGQMLKEQHETNQHLQDLRDILGG